MLNDTTLYYYADDTNVSIHWNSMWVLKRGKAKNEIFFMRNS